MKRNHLALVLGLLLCMESSAQTFDFGLKAGMNIANLKISFSGLSATSDDLISFHGGVYGVWMTSERFGIQPEVLYSAQGGGGSGGNFNLDYITVPVMLRYTFTPGVFIQGGPQVGLLLNAKVDGTDVKEAMNTTDFGLGFGIGVDRPSGVNFGFRYVIGLSNTLSSAFNSAAASLGLSGFTMTNSVIQLSIGYRLSKK